MSAPKPGDRVVASWRSTRAAVDRLVPSTSPRVLPPPDPDRYRDHAAAVEACQAAREKAGIK